MAGDLAAALVRLAPLAEDAAHRVDLAGGSVRLRLVTDHPYLAAWLAEASVPYLTPAGANSQPAETLHVTVDADLAAAVRDAYGDHPDAAGRAVDGGHIARITTTVGEVASDAFVTWLDAHPAVTRVVLADHGAAGGKLLLRTLRGIAARLLLQAGWLPLHAACAHTPAGGVLLLGPSAAGKTTTLVHLLAASTDTALVANSDVWCASGGDGTVMARALPMAATLRAATVAMFPALADVAHPADGSQWSIPSGSLAAAFGTHLRPQTTLIAVVGIDHRGETTPSWHHVTRARQRCGLLDDAYLTTWLGDHPYERVRLTLDAVALQDCHRRTLEEFAIALPGVVLQPGADPAGALGQCLRGLGS